MNLWNIKAGWYGSIRHFFIINWILRKEKQNIAEFVRKYKIEPDKLLDIGAGEGETSTLFDNKTVLFAVDSSMRMLGICRKKGYLPAAADAVVMPFKSEIFPVVTGVGLSEYIERLNEFFSEAARILLPGGYFITTRAQFNIVNFLRNISGAKVRCWKEDRFIKSAEKNGLCLLDKTKSLMQVQYIFKKERRC